MIFSGSSPYLSFLPHRNVWPTKVGHGLLCRGVKLIFTGGHISLVAAFKGPNVIFLGLYECNYSLTVKRELSAAVLLLGRNKAQGWIKKGGGLDSALGLVFATCGLLCCAAYPQQLAQC